MYFGSFASNTCMYYDWTFQLHDEVIFYIIWSYFYFYKNLLCFLGCLWHIGLLQRQHRHIYTIHVQHSGFHYALCFGLQVLWNSMHSGFSVQVGVVWPFRIVGFGLFSFGWLLLFSVLFPFVSFTATTKLLQLLHLFYVLCISQMIS